MSDHFWRVVFSILLVGLISVEEQIAVTFRFQGSERYQERNLKELGPNCLSSFDTACLYHNPRHNIVKPVFDSKKLVPFFFRDLLLWATLRQRNWHLLPPSYPQPLLFSFEGDKLLLELDMITKASCYACFG